MRDQRKKKKQKLFCLLNIFSYGSNLGSGTLSARSVPTSSTTTSSVPILAIVLPIVLGLLLIAGIIVAIVCGRKACRNRQQAAPPPVQPEQLEDVSMPEVHAAANVVPAVQVHSAPAPAPQAVVFQPSYAAPLQYGAYESTAASAAFAAMQATTGNLRYTEANLRSCCIVCMDLPKNMLFHPCSHVCACQRDAASMTDCPMCRAPIVNMVPLKFGQIASLQDTYLLWPCNHAISQEIAASCPICGEEVTHSERIYVC